MGLSRQTSARARRIGVFGGTFDPIHRGHIEIARFARDAAKLDAVLMVPAGNPWLRDLAPIASAEHRLAMTRLAVDDEPELEVSDVDAVRVGATYTVDTLQDLRAQLGPGAEFVLVLGADSALTMDRWERAQELTALCEVLVIGRPGEKWPGDLPPSHPARDARYIEGPMLDVSATEIRAKLAAGEEVGESLLPAVVQYIKSHGLYSS